MQSGRKVWNRWGEMVLVGTALGASSLAAAAPLPQAVQAALQVQHSPLLLGAGEGEGRSKPATSPHTSARHTTAKASATKSSEGGEGEGGAVAAAPISDDIAYLSLLGQVRGHLAVGVALYEAGAVPMALSHMKHPGDELYRAIKPAMDARHAADFAPALSALAKAVETGAPLAEVKAAHQALEEAIRRTESVVDSSSPAALATVLGTVHALVHSAAEEYALGVQDGRIINAHEYQDAWGFSSIARRWMQSLNAEQRTQASDAIGRVEAQLDALLSSAWPSVVPPERLSTDASDLYGAAARIELAYRSLK